MKAKSLLVTFALLALFGASASAADFSTIDRTIAKEPKYKGQPKYCLLVFGAEAKTRVWLVIDGDTLYVDCNGNGDLTERDERFAGMRLPHASVRWSVGEIVEADGTKYQNLRITQRPSEVRIGVDVPGRGYRVAGSDLSGDLVFADHCKDAPIVHLVGPLELSLDHFPREETPPRSNWLPVTAVVGTPGEGKGTFSVLSSYDAFEFNKAKFACEATFTATRPGAKPLPLAYDFDCY